MLYNYCSMCAELNYILRLFDNGILLWESEKTAHPREPYGYRAYIVKNAKRDPVIRIRLVMR
jgi:hypothetical protein